MTRPIVSTATVIYNNETKTIYVQISNLSKPETLRLLQLAALKITDELMEPSNESNGNVPTPQSDVEFEQQQS